MPLAGALVHPGFAAGTCLAVLGDVGVADRARRGPRSPPGRVVGCPLGQVEVEGADREQVVKGVEAGRGDLGDLSATGAGPGRLGGDPLLPRGGRLGGQVQRGDARVVKLEVAPEQPAQRVRELVQGGVVDSGLTFAQVVHQQVPDRAAGDGVAIDQLLAAELALGLQRLPGRGGIAEDARGPQQLVEVRAGGIAAAQQVPGESAAAPGSRRW